MELSFANRRQSPDLLAWIGRLLDEALRQGELPIGSTPAQVRRVIGPPSLRRGDETDASFDWGYPHPAPADQPAGDDWYLLLRFRDGVLHAIETRIWREGR